MIVLPSIRSSVGRPLLISEATDAWSIGLDGTNDEVSIADTSVLSFGDGVSDSPFSVSAWFRYIGDTSGANAFPIFTKGDSGTLEWSVFVATDKLTFKIYTTDTDWVLVKTDSSLSENTWYHVLVTYDGTNADTSGLKIYLDGALQSTTSTPGGTYTYMSDKAGAAHMGALGTIFGQGHVSQASVWSSELEANEVLSLYASGVPSDPTQDGGSYTSSANLVGYWPCENTGTTIVPDGSSNSNDGTRTNGATYDPLVPNLTLPSWSNTNSLNFDDTDDYVDLGNFDPNSLIGSGAFTVAMWFKIDSTSDHDTILSWTNSNGADEVMFKIQYINGTGVRFSFRDSGGSYQNVYSTATISAATWYHLIVTRSGTTANIYINNADNANSTNSNIGVDFTGLDLHAIGLSTSSGSPNLGGNIRDYAVFNRVISSSERATLYGSGTPVDARTVSGADPIGFWPLDSTLGLTALDYSTNNRHGVLYNGPTWEVDAP